MPALKNYMRHRENKIIKVNFNHRVGTNIADPIFLEKVKFYG